MAFALVPESSPAAPAVSALVSLFGGALEREAGGPPTALFVDLDAAVWSDADEARARSLRHVPTYFLRSSDGPAEAALGRLHRISGRRVTAGRGRDASGYAFHAGAPAPFRGLTLQEDTVRSVSPIEADPELETVISTDAGPVVVRWQTDVLSMVAVRSPRVVVREELHGTRFAALLPLAAFIREVLGPEGWRSTGVRATLMVDDANLRRFRYGYLDYRSVARQAAAEGWHLSVAMIPLDYRATSPRVAAFFREHPRELSLLMHGVDHVRRELGRAVTPDGERLLVEGLRRMETHRARTHLEHAPAITCPHGRFNLTWAEPMRRVGLEAVFVRSPIIVLQGDRGGLADTWDLAPATMVGGLPVVSRFRFDRPMEALLVEAWLGKPLVVYLHHDAFGDGGARVGEVVAFLNARVGPTWGDVPSVLASNVQVREGRRGREVRRFEAGPAEPASHARPARRRPSSVGRRVLTEARDRMQPLAAGVRRRRRASDSD